MSQEELTSRIYVFGDETFNFEESLAQLLRSNDRLLKWFFHDVYAAVREELGRLPSHARDSTPKISSITDLLSRKRDATISPALSQVLCVIHLLASFIGQHSQNNLSYPTGQNSQLLGIGAGSFAVAAISSAKDLSQLIPVAVHATIVALHTGLRASLAAQSTSACDQSNSWATVFVGVTTNDMSQILDRFHAANNVPASSYAYISAISAAGVTLSGPPSVLTKLRNSNETAHLDRAVLCIESPYHAKHIYDDDDIRVIMEKAERWNKFNSTAQIPVLSCGNGHSVWVNNSQGLMRVAIQDVLIRPVMVEKTIDHLGAILKTAPPKSLLIVPVGTDASGTIHHRLQNALADYTSVSVGASWPSAEELASGPSSSRSKIAVIGMSGRFPGASNHDELWDLLQRKVDMCKEVPALRWDVNTHVDPTGKAKNTSKVRWGCWLEQPDLFDAPFFAISPREAPQVDPAQRIALMTTYEAMEHAGVVPDRTPSTRKDRVGVYYGVTSNDWCESNSGQDVDAYYIPGANRAFIPGRVNYFFKFSGPSYAVDTACSSSLSAVHIACNSLWQGDIDMAIAGGTNVLTNPDMTTGLDKGHFLSTTGNCKTFDATADGYCRGEGVATILLKRMEDAIEDGDPIQGIIASAYTNHSAEAESITRPHVGAQNDVLERVLNDSGTHPYDIGYVEMHGTGTQAGDTREIKSVTGLLAPANALHKRGADRPLHLGALKANIGHGESASGVCALIKVMMMMNKSQIPPHCGIKTHINPSFPTDLTERNVHIDLEATAWPRFHPNMPRKAIINNFSAAGGNSSVLVEEFMPQAYRKKIIQQSPSRPLYPVAISARSGKSLKANVEALIAHLPKMSSTTLPGISYTTTARRQHHAFRVVTSATDIQSLSSKLTEALQNEETSPTKRIVAPKSMTFAFTGQGSQYPGMGKQFMETMTVFRDQIVQFDRLARQLGFPSILPLFNASNGGDITDYSPIVVQLANTCMQIALARIWISWGITPTAVVGHSLGEYAALNIAGVLSDSDTVFLVGTRALHLQNYCEPGSHAMLAVAASVPELDAVAAKELASKGDKFEIACINAPKETVLAGTAAQVSGWKQTLTAAGLRNTLLRVPYAFHSSQIQPILSAFEEDAKGVVFCKPKLPVICPLEGKVVTEAGTFGPKYVARHAREPVKMMSSLKAASNTGIVPSTGGFAIEFGPHPVVSGMINATLGSAVSVLPTLRRNTDPWDVLTKSLCSLYAAGCPVEWDGYFADVPSAREVVELPAYNWDMKSHWIAYRNDWTLTKGDIPIERANQSIAAAKTSTPIANHITAPAPVSAIPKLESTTIHRVLEEKETAGGFSIVIGCDVDREDVNPFIRSHTVDGYSLCTPAVYADISFSLGTYVLERYQPQLPERVVSIQDVDITRALIGSADWKQQLRCSAQFDWASKGAKLRFTVHDQDGKEVGQLSTSKLQFVDDRDRKTLQASLPTVKAKFDQMKMSDTASRFPGSISYRLVSQLAEFNPDYHCIDDVLYDSDAYEAACRVSFGKMKRGGIFHTSPGAIDGLTQSAGFVMNANNGTQLDTDVFVNHGWMDFQLFERIRDDCQYSTHVKMSQGEENLWSGDISIFTGDRAVGIVKGVRIQGLPRKFLKFVLSQAAKPPKSVKARTGSANSQSVTTSKPVSAPTPVIKQAPAAKVAPVPAPVSVPAPVITPALKPSTDNWRATRAVEIISEQSEVPISDLKDETRLDEIGVDSLLSLMITSLLAEELGIAADTPLFEESETIADVKKFIGGDTDDEPQPQIDTVTEIHTTVFTDSQQGVIQQATEVTSSVTDLAANNNKFGEVLQIMAEEAEIEVETLTDEASMSELGIDSLLSLLIGSRLTDELDIEVDAASLLTELSTIGALRQALFPAIVVSNGHSGNASIATAEKHTNVNGSAKTNGAHVAVNGFETENGTHANVKGHGQSNGHASVNGYGQKNGHAITNGNGHQNGIPAPLTEPVPASNSVILQGNPRNANKTLWFFPDGSGLASSYSTLSRIRDDMVVYGLNSPYLKKGVEMKCTWDGLIGSFIREIQRRQPQGPYSFAGWSAGGIGAYHAAQVLMNAGHVVRDLIILDSPPPFHLAPLPERFFQYCAMAGLFGGRDGHTPEWVIKHFRSINEVLSHYVPTPLGKSTLRKINILWACESSVDERFEIMPDDPEDMKFLVQKRTDFSPGRWGPLFGNVPVQVDRADGQHHWGILKGNSAGKVTEYIRRILV